MAFDQPGPRGSDVMCRLTLSAMDRASDSPGFWGEPEVHRALLVSGLLVWAGVSLIPGGK